MAHFLSIFKKICNFVAENTSFHLLRLTKHEKDCFTDDCPSHRGIGIRPDFATNAALKIYGIEFLRDDTPTDIDRPTPDPSLNGGENWYTIDGKKLNGEPKKKGIYVVKGKKVKK